MRIDIAGPVFNVTGAVKSYAELRVRDAVGYLEARIDTLCVRVVKVNGGTAGEATRCRLVAHLFAGSPICSVSTAADPYLAIDRAAAGLYDGLEAADVQGSVAQRVVRHAVASVLVGRGSVAEGPA